LAAEFGLKVAIFCGRTYAFLLVLTTGADIMVDLVHLINTGFGSEFQPSYKMSLSFHLLLCTFCRIGIIWSCFYAFADRFMDAFSCVE
jgi:hypothetical protein